MLRVQELYIGNVNTALIRVAEVLRPAIRENAPAMIIVHNHPSGDPSPSREDEAVTREVRQAGELLDIELVDHVILGSGGRFASLKDLGRGF